MTNLMAADYTCSAQETCAALVQAWADHTGNLDFLSHIELNRSFPSQSFVPDWSRRPFRPDDHWDFGAGFGGS